MSEFSVLLPYPEHLKLLNVLSVMILMVHLPYIGMLIGSTLLSVHCLVQDKIEPSARVRRLAGDLAHLVPTNFAVYLMLGIIPLPTLMLVYSEWFYQTSFQLFHYFTYITVVTFIGLVFVYIYNRTMAQKNPNFFFAMNIGGLGILLLIGAYYVFVNVIAMTFRPESWPLTWTPVPVLFEANSFARFILFMVICFALTGLGILFFWFNWQKRDFDPAYRKFVRSFGLIISSATILLLPLLIIWDVMTRPENSYSVGVFSFSILALFFLIFISFSLYKFISQPESAITKAPFVLFILVIFAMVISDDLAKLNANLAHTNLVIDQGTAVEVALENKRTAGEVVVPDVALGEKIYKGRCMTCHTFDHRVVGPPHNEVLPKYYHDQATLIQFILHPHYINYSVTPPYPEMPPQPLNKKEVESVVAYMMKHIEEEKLVTPSADTTSAATPIASTKR